MFSWTIWTFSWK